MLHQEIAQETMNKNLEELSIRNLQRKDEKVPQLDRTHQEATMPQVGDSWNTEHREREEKTDENDLQPSLRKTLLDRLTSNDEATNEERLEVIAAQAYAS